MGAIVGWVLTTLLGLVGAIGDGVLIPWVAWVVGALTGWVVAGIGIGMTGWVFAVVDGGGATTGWTFTALMGFVGIMVGGCSISPPPRTRPCVGIPVSAAVTSEETGTWTIAAAATNTRTGLRTGISLSLLNCCSSCAKAFALVSLALANGLNAPLSKAPGIFTPPLLVWTTEVPSPEVLTTEVLPESIKALPTPPAAPQMAAVLSADDNSPSRNERWLATRAVLLLAVSAKAPTGTLISVPSMKTPLDVAVTAPLSATVTPNWTIVPTGKLNPCDNWIGWSSWTDNGVSVPLAALLRELSEV